MYHHHDDDSAAASSTITHDSKHPLTGLRSNDRCRNWVGSAREQGAAPRGPRQTATTRRSSTFHAGGGDVSAKREAINASGALNRPRRSSGGTIASTASSFSEGSMRR